MILPNPEFSASSSQASNDEAAQSRNELIALVQRAEAEEPDAQRELVQRYTKRLRGFVRSIIGSRDAVEDVTQTILIKMFRRLGRLRDASVFEAWLFTLARNTCLDHLRRCRCRPRTVELGEETHEISDPSAAGSVDEILAALDLALARLSPLDAALVRQYVGGDSYHEIAARTGLSLASVKVRLHRVRPYLRNSVGAATGTRPAEAGWRSTSLPRAA